MRNAATVLSIIQDRGKRSLPLERLYRLLYNPHLYLNHSHGFRPGRGCHTALRAIQQTWTGTRWFIEGDIASCFDAISQEVFLNILAEKIHDQRCLRLILQLLQAGYLEQ
jgi:retron-type reverse transcriptase